MSATYAAETQEMPADTRPPRKVVAGSDDALLHVGELNYHPIAQKALESWVPFWASIFTRGESSYAVARTTT